MASLRYYATFEDLLEILAFVYDETDCRVFEAYSRFNKELREFANLEEFESAQLERSLPGGIHLNLISPAVAKGPKIRKFKLADKIGGGFRYTVDQAGVIGLVEGKVRKDIDGEPLDWSVLSHWSEKGARQRSDFSNRELRNVNWRELERISRRIRYHISKRLAVAKYGGMPILSNAFRGLEEGPTLWAGPGLLTADSDVIQRL